MRGQEVRGEAVGMHGAEGIGSQRVWKVQQGRLCIIKEKGHAGVALPLISTHASSHALQTVCRFKVMGYTVQKTADPVPLCARSDCNTYSPTFHRVASECSQTTRNPPQSRPSSGLPPRPAGIEK